MAYQRLTHTFYRQPDVVRLSQDLLGKYLVTELAGGRTVGRIVETEAYRAPDDKACHAYGNKRTQRTETMFRAGGVAYVYLCYGIHHLFNVVTAPEGTAHAVLIRAIEPIENLNLMQQRRGLTHLRPQLTAGPGVMTKALGITTRLNGIDLADPASPVWIEDRGDALPPDTIVAGPRVGVSYAEECAEWYWRFVIKESKWISKPI